VPFERTSRSTYNFIPTIYIFKRFYWYVILPALLYV